eukprot:scaffold4678_cov242-Pinguiococcus_pyrenoidosus.AAC.5
MSHAAHRTHHEGTFTYTIPPETRRKVGLKSIETLGVPIVLYTPLPYLVLQYLGTRLRRI